MKVSSFVKLAIFGTAAALAVSKPAYASYDACSPTTPVVPCTSALSVDMDSVVRNNTTVLFYKSEAYNLNTIPDTPYNYRQLVLKNGYAQSNGYAYLSGPSWSAFGQFDTAGLEENSYYASNIGMSFLPIPQSPVNGDIILRSAVQNCSGVTDWCFYQHQTGAHTATGGVGTSDDVYAWDINLPNDADDGEPVYAVEDGTVSSSTEGYAGQTNAGGTYGQLLIQHNYYGLTWWSGYLHLENIQVSTSASVSKGDLLGYISNTGLGGGANHLHLVVYTGTNSSGNLDSFDTIFTEK